jgi:hypothetical protein
MIDSTLVPGTGHVKLRPDPARGPASIRKLGGCGVMSGCVCLQLQNCREDAWVLSSVYISPQGGSISLF